MTTATATLPFDLWTPHGGPPRNSSLSSSYLPMFASINAAFPLLSSFIFKLLPFSQTPIFGRRSNGKLVQTNRKRRKKCVQKKVKTVRDSITSFTILLTCVLCYKFEAYISRYQIANQEEGNRFDFDLVCFVYDPDDPLC